MGASAIVVSLWWDLKVPNTLLVFETETVESVSEPVLLGGGCGLDSD
jgi:hypothetical protein